MKNGHETSSVAEDPSINSRTSGEPAGPQPPISPEGVKNPNVTDPGISINRPPVHPADEPNPARLSRRRTVSPSRHQPTDGDDAHADASQTEEEAGMNRLVRGPKGQEGTIIGFEERQQERYVKIREGDVVRLVPHGRFREQYTTVAHGEHQSSEEIDLEPVRAEVRARLQQAIDNVSNYTADTLHVTYTSERLEARVRGVIDEAKRNRAVFRMDTRHPSRVKKADLKAGMPGAVFEEGFVPRAEETFMDEGEKYLKAGVIPRSETAYFGVYTTPTPAFAMSYPEESDVPPDWDEKKYLYIVDNEALLQNPRSVRITTEERDTTSLDLEIAESTDAAVEIESGTIAPKYIKYGLEIDTRENRLLRVFANPGYQGR